MESLLKKLQKEVDNLGINMTTPFSKAFTRKEKHLHLNFLARQFWNEVKNQKLTKGHHLWGISFHPKHQTPQVIYKSFKNKEELYNELIGEGVEVYCIVSSESTILETEEQILPSSCYYYSIGTSFGKENGIFHKETSKQTLLQFAQPLSKVA